MYYLLNTAKIIKKTKVRNILYKITRFGQKNVILVHVIGYKKTL